MFDHLAVNIFAGEPVSDHEAQGTEPATHATEAASHAEEAKEKEGFNPGKVIIDHISDSHEWHFFSFEKTDGSEIHGSLPLPVILYSPSKGLSMFSYGRFHHGHSEYNGYKVEEDVIMATDGSPVYDFSLTKNVMQMLIGVSLMLLIFLSVARNFKKYGTKAPRGIHSVVEVVVMFIRDQIAKPLLGEKSGKYLPYLLTLFFFIWINNLIGLVPGAAKRRGKDR